MAQPNFGFEIREDGMDLDALLDEIRAKTYLPGPYEVDDQTAFEDEFSLISQDDDSTLTVLGEFTEQDGLMFGLGTNIGYDAEGGGGGQTFIAAGEGPGTFGVQNSQIDWDAIFTDLSLVIYAASGDETASGGENDDILYGNGGDDLLRGLAGEDTLLGQNGADLLIGGDGDDDLRGGRHSDELRGGDDDDVLRGHAGDDVLKGQQGDDVLLGGAGDDVLLGQAGADALNGGADDDMLKGGGGEDELRGDAGDDVLRGQQGDDLLHVSAGDDLLVGGGGADRYSLSTEGPAATNRARGFDAETDVIRLHNINEGDEIAKADATVKKLAAQGDTRVTLGDQVLILEDVLLAKGELTFEVVNDLLF